MNPQLGLLLANPLAAKLATTVTTFAPGDPKLATSDPSNTTGLVMVILVNVLIIGGGVLLYLRHRRRPGAEPSESTGRVTPATTATPKSD